MQVQRIYRRIYFISVSWLNESSSLFQLHQKFNLRLWICLCIVLTENSTTCINTIFSVLNGHVDMQRNLFVLNFIYIKIRVDSWTRSLRQIVLLVGTTELFKFTNEICLSKIIPRNFVHDPVSYIFNRKYYRTPRRLFGFPNEFLTLNDNIINMELLHAPNSLLVFHSVGWNVFN